MTFSLACPFYREIEPVTLHHNSSCIFTHFIFTFFSFSGRDTHLVMKMLLLASRVNVIVFVLFGLTKGAYLIDFSRVLHRNLANVKREGTTLFFHFFFSLPLPFPLSLSLSLSLSLHLRVSRVPLSITCLLPSTLCSLSRFFLFLHFLLLSVEPFVCPCVLCVLLNLDRTQSAKYTTRKTK